MNTRPIVAAPLAYTEEGVPYSNAYSDVYHPSVGAFVQARHVFIAGNEIPQRWQGRRRFTVFETGFGLGNNFLATWQAWRDDPARCDRLIFVSVEQSPFSSEDLRRAHAASPARDLATQLVEAWPVLTHNLHALDFEGGRVRLMLAFGDAQAWLPELVLQADAFYLDGFAPARNPQMWQPRLFKALGRIAAPGATLATWTAAGAVRDGLNAAGFNVRKAPGTGGKRDITLARYAPRFIPARPPSRHNDISTHCRAVIVGAGLAGAALAQALAAEGWSSTLYESSAAPALQTSGNPGGLFHGVVNGHDGIHARFHRAAALMAQRTIAMKVAHGMQGAVDGLLRLDRNDVEAMAQVIERLGLPHTYARAVSATEASRLCGFPLRHAAWHYPGGGWVKPAALVHAWLDEAADHAHLHCNVRIDRLQRAGTAWQLLDDTGRLIDECETVVLANAAGATRLLGDPRWPLCRNRGQISHFQRSLAPGMPLPTIPVAGAGYLLPEVDGQVIFGATSHLDDPDGTVRETDNAANLAELNALLAGTLQAPLQVPMQGRVGWRVTSRDRLPVVGAVPDTAARSSRLDQPRFVPRIPGLFVFTALGSRGIATAALAGRTLASWITGAASPLEASLLDAIDPARFVSRDARQGQSRPAHSS